MAEVAVATALAQARAALIAVDTPTATLDARLLLQDVLGLDHAGLIASDDRVLTADECALFQRHVVRRVAHEPVSKILGRRDFYGRVFHVSGDVLDPRADSEAVIELALELFSGGAPRLLDLGSGSGALICTLLAEWPEARGVAVDVSGAALAMTARNARSLGLAARLVLTGGSWFETVEGVFDLIVSNPPYIATADIAALEPDVREYDPLLALDGGDDGLACYRAIAAGVQYHLAESGGVIVEIGAGQASDVTAIFVGAGLVPAGQRKDLGGHVRALAFAASKAMAAD